MSMDHKPPWNLDPLSTTIEKCLSLEKDKDRLWAKITELERERDKREEALKEEFVSHDDFKPVKMIVYGLVAVILMAVITSLVSLVVRQQH